MKRARIAWAGAIHDAIEADGPQRFTRQFAILRTFPVPASEMRMTAGEGGFQHGRTKGIVLELTQPGPAQGGMARRKQGGIFAVEHDGTRCRRA